MSNNVKKVSGEIRSMLINALRQKEWYFFENPSLVKCWEEMGCSRSDCPAYQSENLRCWQMAGTYCGGEPQGTFAKKIGDCHKCKVYVKATGGNVVLQIGEDFNNLMFQLKTKEDELRNSIQDSEEKNRELAELNEKIQKLVKKLDSKNLQLKKLSEKDGLTGLYNYRFFRKSLREQFKMARRYSFSLSCLMIDIDYFKAVNDTYGHQFGDEILKQLSGILVKHVRDTDKVVRYGGEEFAVLLPHTDLEGARAKAEQLRELISAADFRNNDTKVGITVSIGAAAYPGGGKIKEYDDLVMRADKALYQAKEKGRNRTVVFTEAETPDEDRGKAERDRELIERRKYPRIQTLIRVTGELNKKEMSFSNAFDISCSGLSLVSREPIETNKILNIVLYLPGVDDDAEKVTPVNAEGLVVWCRKIEDTLSGGTSRTKPPPNYLIGIQFSNISRKDSIYLQKFFFSIFKIKRQCLR